MKTIICGGEAHQPKKVIQKSYIVIENERIANVKDLSNLDENDINDIVEARNSRNLINAFGMIIAPGSIETHTHGLNNTDFIEIDFETLEKILKLYPKYGVTSVSPTIMTGPKERIKTAFSIIGKYHEDSIKRKKLGANLLSCYLECRYFGIEKRGAHSLDELVNSADEYKKRYNLSDDCRTLLEIILDEIAEFDSASKGFIRAIAIDPSLEGALEVIKILEARDYKIAIAHSNCTQGQAKKL